MLTRTFVHPGVFNSIAHEMDRLFENLAGSTRAVAPAFVPGVSYPAMNVWEDEASFHVEAELPGMSQEDLDLSILGHELTLKGSRRFDLPENSQIIRRERAAGTFERTISLPVDVNAEKVEATFTNGVLSITLPKAQAALPRKIDVRQS